MQQRPGSPQAPILLQDPGDTQPCNSTAISITDTSTLPHHASVARAGLSTFSTRGPLHRYSPATDLAHDVYVSLSTGPQPDRFPVSTSRGSPTSLHQLHGEHTRYPHPTLYHDALHPSPKGTIRLACCNGDPSLATPHPTFKPHAESLPSQHGNGGGGKSQ